MEEKFASIFPCITVEGSEEKMKVPLDPAPNCCLTVAVSHLALHFYCLKSQAIVSCNFAFLT